MIWKIVLLLGVAVAVNGDEEAVSEQKVTIHHPKHGIISHAGDKQDNHKDYEWSYPSYEFSYKVKDPHTHDIKGQKEERDGDKVKGDYWLIEPTGRKRTVKYHADDEVGFNAHVDYSKSEYSHKEKNQDNQVEDRRLNSQEDEQQVQKNGSGYEAMEGNKENENNNENGEGENSGDQRGNGEDILNKQEENGGPDLIEQIENNENNENQQPISEAMVTLEALNDNNEPQDKCKCNERRQIDYKSNINEVKNKNNNYGVQDMTSRKKRKNMSRSINLKRDNGENIKHIEVDAVEKNNNKKLSHSDGNKNSQNNNLNDKKKKNDSANFGNRNGKRKQILDKNKYEDQPQNNTVKIEEIKESENMYQNDDDHKYQHRILIHHPKIIAQTANKKS